MIREQRCVLFAMNGFESSRWQSSRSKKRERCGEDFE